ncbi:MAG TPA: phosphatidylserine/phosphatidylglycerophosphate/cardiolipin synthase family protein [Candidatus Ozemobacteraceae bacterium]
MNTNPFRARAHSGNRLELLLAAGLFAASVFYAPALAATSTNDVQAAHDRYVAIYKEYSESVRQNSATEKVEKLAAELRSAQAEYERAVRGGSTADAAMIPSSNVISSTGGDLSSTEESSSDQDSDTTGTSKRRLSSERQAFENLLVKLYGPERKSNPAGLLTQLRSFIKGVFESRLKVEATWELAELLMESTGSVVEAKKTLNELAATTRDPEIRRQAAARVKQYDLETRIGTQRKAFDAKRLASISAWTATSKTSWLAFPVKAARWTKWLVTDGGRRIEAHKLRQLLDEYETVVADTFEKGTIDEKTASRLIPANTITMLVNGRSSFTKRFELVGAAKSSICIQTLLWNDDEIGNKMADLLIGRVKDGVDVRVIVDDAFAFTRRKGIIRRMQNGGVRVLINNPLLRNTLKANFRSHQKMLIVDEGVAIVGGMNMATEYAKGEIEEYGWRDTDVMVTGPVVDEIGELFENNWERLVIDERAETGAPGVAEVKDKDEKLPILPDRSKLIPGPLPVYFEEPPVFENVRVRFLKTFPARSDDDDILDLFIEYMNRSSGEVIFESAYFIPTPTLKNAIVAACRRGVKVKILTNSVESNNHPQAGIAGRANYEDVMKAGAEIYEWRGAQTLHSKVSWFDGMAATVGAYNVNSRSHACDSEDVLSIEDRRVARSFEIVLRRDLSRARKVTAEDLEAWRDTFKERAVMDIYNLFKWIF